MSHIQKVRIEHASVKLQVLNLLGWSELQWGEFQEQMGRTYLERLQASGEFTEEITRSKLFWSWWRLHWVVRDREFMELVSMLWPDEVVPYYRELHDPASMTFKPHSVVLEASYTKMMHRIIKKEVSHA